MTTTRTGRPRRSRRPSTSGEPRRDILSVASTLFAQRGVGPTTMAEIARRSGLQQSSLYYYFAGKEELLDAIVAEANRASLELVDRVRREDERPAVQLYRLVRADVVALSTLPYDLNELHRLALRDRRTFARYWRERRRLVTAVTSIVRAGVDAGDLREVDPRLAALTLLSNDEATQNWLRGEERADPNEVGAFLADLTLRGLMAAPRSLERVRRAAGALDAVL